MGCRFRSVTPRFWMLQLICSGGDKGCRSPRPEYWFGRDGAEADDEFDSIGNRHVQLSYFAFRHHHQKTAGWIWRGRDENADRFLIVVLKGSVVFASNET